MYFHEQEIDFEKNLKEHCLDSNFTEMNRIRSFLKNCFKHFFVRHPHFN